MDNYFVGRSLCVIDDFNIEERAYLFDKVKTLKKAMANDDKKVLDSFRINNPDFGMYEVFLEDSTRTKESFKNAAKFHLTKVSELSVTTSSFNKGESYSDTFNTLAGYSNSIFIIRSKVEGVCAHLENQCAQFAKRNNLVRKPSFINAGDGKHEHPTQELLDEYTFLEDNDFNYDSLHIALVGDLFHGRTVHSKANGLKLFKKVKIDLVAPNELAMPETYISIMKENGFEVNTFSSIEEYLESSEVANKWYFTRPQLERMGEQILKRQAQLRASITFRKEFLDKLPANTKFYHPLPRHKLTPTIPTFLDKTELNGWEKQSINGMFVRIVLLGMLGGSLGNDFNPNLVKKPNYTDEEYIIKVETDKNKTKKKDYSEGVNPIDTGIVIDHICKGDTPKEIREHMALISKIMEIEDGKGGEWVSLSSDGQYKGILFRPGNKIFSRKELKRLAAIAPGCTLNIIKNHVVVEKYRTTMPPRIYNFDDLCCKNEACISNPAQGENVEAMFFRTKDHKFICSYCGKAHSFKEIFK
ncbi:MAG: bifunctional aspartate carbamoyltransferase catalytic subunit/aspartate carbamoyltransferase regulatory subunit [Pleomorphochaeta sp.]|jgi:aspartate carbamoyltransferase